MQTRVRLESIAGLGQKPKTADSDPSGRPQFSAYLLTFAQVTPDATGNPVGNVHLTNTDGTLQMILESGQGENLAVGSDYILNITRADAPPK